MSENDDEQSETITAVIDQETAQRIIALAQEQGRDPLADDAEIDAAIATHDALAGELGNLAQQFEGAADAEKRQEGVEPKDIFGDPFDLSAAWADIVGTNTAFQEASRDYDRKHKAANAAKDERDTLAKLLSVKIADYTGRQRDSQQPRLRAVTTDAEPASEATAGRDALLQDLSFKLLGRQCFLSIAELAGLSDDDRGALHTWAVAKKRGPLYPPVLATAHVAAEAGPAGQHCAKCGAVLSREEVAGSSREFGGPMPYVAKSFVGFGCIASEPDEARPTKRRGSKKTAKVDPEAERAAQEAAAATAGDGVAAH